MSANKNSGRGDTTMPWQPGDDDLRKRKLLVLADDGVTAHVLPEQGTLSIGRAEEADITIDRHSISRRHALLHLSPDRIEIEDVGSSNGTRVAGRKLDAAERIVVGPGDHLEVGGVTVLVQGPTIFPGGTAKIDADAASAGGLPRLAARVARSELSVLIGGETGVGKEVLALRIHELSPRGRGPFVPLNCAALSEELLASELFGYEKGAFTGAHAAKPGLLETAELGTVFLDEVGEMPMSQQVKLLRVLEERKVMRVGGLQARAIDVRFVSATHRDLRKEVAAGRFREDLYYRLNGITLRIPPLRERTAEIAGLAQEFLAGAAVKAGLALAPPLSAEAHAALLSHPWPGNVRQLKNVIERAVVLAGDEPVRPEHLFNELDELGGGTAPLPERGEVDERTRIVQALQQCGSNQTRAAALLGVSRRTLGTWMDRHGIARPQKSRR